MNSHVPEARGLLGCPRVSSWVDMVRVEGWNSQVRVNVHVSLLAPPPSPSVEQENNQWKDVYLHMHVHGYMCKCLRESPFLASV